MNITKLHALEVLDSKGNPTVEVNLTLDRTFSARAIVPSSHTDEDYSAKELRDTNKSRYFSQGVLTAVNNVNTFIYKSIKSKSFDEPTELDKYLIELDGTEDKSRLGSNAILGVSLAFTKAIAKAHKLKLYKFLAEIYDKNPKLSKPIIRLDYPGSEAISAFLLEIDQSKRFSENLKAAIEIFNFYHSLIYTKEALEKDNFKTLVEAMEELGLNPKKGFSIGVETLENGVKELQEVLKNESIRILLTSVSVEKISKYEKLDVERIILNDVVGVNKDRLRRSVEEGIADSYGFDMARIGTVTETLEYMKMIEKKGRSNVVLSPDGDTEDNFLAHLAVGTGSENIIISVDDPSSKSTINELLRIEKLEFDEADVI